MNSCWSVHLYVNVSVRLYISTSVNNFSRNLFISFFLKLCTTIKIRNLEIGKNEGSIFSRFFRFSEIVPGDRL